MRPSCEVHRPGRVDYATALRWQEDLVAARQAGRGEDTLWLLEHPRVLTLGRNAHAENVLLSPAELEARGFETHEVGRGGDVTYHGPGQLVGYPVLLLAESERDAHAYLRRLEEVLVHTLADFGVEAFRHPPHTGVWVEQAGEPRKIAAIGVRFARWVSSHGFALNVNCELDDFAVIVPCGIADHGVTSLQSVLGREVDMAAVMDRVEHHFSAVFERGLRPATTPNSPEAVS